MSRHPWYTPTGLVSRAVFTAATTFEPAKIPCAVLYGLIEVLGLKETVKAMITLSKKTKESNNG